MQTSSKPLPTGEQAKISVIMSVYNGRPYLKEAIRSILTQTYKNFEFIIVDDASTDDSLKYLKSLKDQRIIIIKNKKNLGLAASLNKALQISSGNFIARMDADDISLPERFKSQLDYLSKHKEVDLCGSWVDLIDEKGQKIGEKKYPTNNLDIKKALCWYPPIIHPTLMSKAKVFKVLHGYKKEYDMAEDYELLLRAKNTFTMANVDRKLLLWRLWDKRRSRQEMDKMDKIDLKIKIEALRKGYFGPLYLFVVIKKIIMTYMLPLSLKTQMAKLVKLA